VWAQDFPQRAAKLSDIVLHAFDLTRTVPVAAFALYPSGQFDFGHQYFKSFFECVSDPSPVQLAAFQSQFAMPTYPDGAPFFRHDRKAECI
jgi:hypothetical protein